MTEVTNESAETLEVITEPTTAEVVETPEEATVGQLIEQTKPAKAESVPLATFLDLKRENKELAKKMEEIQRSSELGASNKEVKQSVAKLSDKYNLDPNFLQDIMDTIKSDTEAEVESKLSSTLKPLQEKERIAKIDELFNKEYDRVIEQMPEFKDIVNKSVIKTLSLDPSNANKTFAKIMEEAYGNLVVGKRTMEASKPGASRDDGSVINQSKMKDPDYYKKVMENPALRKQYNDGLERRLGL